MSKIAKSTSPNHLLHFGSDLSSALARLQRAELHFLLLSGRLYTNSCRKKSTPWVFCAPPPRPRWLSRQKKQPLITSWLSWSEMAPPREMGGATSNHEASGSQEHKELRPSHRELWDTSLFPSGCFAFDFHGAELFLPLPPDSKLPTSQSQNRHRSHRQSGRRRHTLTPQHFGGKSKPSCRPGGGGQ